MPKRGRLVGCLVISLALWTTRAAEAQTAGYVAGGSSQFGCCGSPFFFGGGIDVVSGIGLGGGAEAGVFFDDTGGLLSGLTLHTIVQPRPRRDRRFVPFGSVGFGGFIGPEVSLTAWHLGVGINWWSRGRIGARVEVRKYFSDHHDPDRILLIRAGVTFR